VLVVGAGPAGAATALLLARAGLPVTLLDRERDFSRVFRGEGLMPTGLDALDQMGLRAGIDALPWRHLEAWEIYLERREIMRIAEPTAELGPRALRVVPQPQLLQLMVTEARNGPHFTFHAGASVRDVLRDGERVRGVRIATATGELDLEADLTLGCDGRASVVRGRADLALDLLPESYDVLWFKVPPPPALAGRSPVLIFAAGAQVALAYVSWDGLLQVAWMLPKGGWRALREEDWLARCARLFPDALADHVLAARAAVDGPVPLDVIVGRCPRWSRPGVLLLGDAAHPMSPVRAQGINMALRDAIVAANHLVPALRDGRDLAPVLAAVQREREREILRIQRLQLAEVRGQRWARERGWLMKPLLAVAPLLARTGLPQRAWLRQQRELRFGVTDVQLTAR
jgi:2-polyprenyl-6-methoxyphenol hydroxylase-like FAD-dependent oxidoreductase